MLGLLRAEVEEAAVSGPVDLVGWSLGGYLAREVARPLTVPVTAIYSKIDGVVSWRACIDERSPNVEHVQVFSSHTGLGFSPQALQVVADRLARSV
jgi:surfactin synthase thioesterase subunit